jgi:hypothetical protein
MCLSPKTYRSNNINPLFQQKNKNRNNSKEEKDNKLSKKKLSSRNNDILKAPKKNLYKKILPNNIFQFSSNNSTSSNTTSNLNNIKTHNHINFDYDNNSNRNPEYLKRNNYINNQNNSNKTKEKIDNFLQRYKNKMKNTMSNSSTDIKRGHNRSLSKNLNQELIISKIVDKLVSENINKINKFNLDLNHKTYKNELEKNFIGSITTKEFNSNNNIKNKINYLITPNYKNIISINNIKSPGLSRHSALTSSTRNICTKKIDSKTNSNININNNACQKRPNSNDNMKNVKIQKKNNSNLNNISKMNLSKSKDIINSVNINNFAKRQKNLSNEVGLNNNQIEYVQINLFNGGNDEKILKEGKNLIFNKFEKKRSQCHNNNNNKKQKNKDKEVKLFDSDINYSNDGNYLTNTYLSYNEKSRQIKEAFTPEENHFQAVSYVQLIKKNDDKFE